MTGADQEIFLARKKEAQSEGTPQTRQGHGDGLDGPTAFADFVGDELGHHFGIRLGFEANTLGFQRGLQLAEILDNAVMDDSQLVGGMGVRIGLVRLAVGRPAGVADSDDTGKRSLGKLGLEVAQLALGAPAVEPARL